MDESLGHSSHAITRIKDSPGSISNKGIKMSEKLKIAKIFGMTLSLGIAVYAALNLPELAAVFIICLFLTLVGLDFVK